MSPPKPAFKKSILHSKARSSIGGRYSDTKCGYCGDDARYNAPVILSCGHVFCYDCARVCVRKEHNCAKCKKAANECDITTLVLS